MKTKQRPDWFDLKGQVITAIKIDGDSMAVYTTTINVLAAHVPACCETMRHIRTDGTIDKLIGHTIDLAEEDAGASDPDWFDERYDESHTWTKLRLVAGGNELVAWFLGESNGYYGETLSFRYVQP